MRRHTKHIKSKNIQINPVRVVLVVVPLLLLIGVISFFRYYALQNVTVLGNVHYTDEEIRAEVTQGLFGSNTWIVSHTKSSFSPTDLELVDQIDVKMKDNHSLQITVQEHQLIGYVQYLDCDLYFDSDGRVMDSVVRGSEEDSTSQVTSDSTSGSTVTGTDSTVDGTQDTTEAAIEDTSGKDTTTAEGSTSAGNAGSESTTDTADTGAADTASGDASSKKATSGGDTAAEQVSDSDTEALSAEAVGKTATSYMAAMKEAPLVTGLSFDSAQLHEILPVADKSVFYTILGISRMINKYDITPDAVNFDENMQITLTYKELTVDLGADQQIEEKLARVAAILPSLEGKSGILHMEDYDGSSQNIVFSQSVLSGESLDEEDTTTSTAAGLTTETKKSVSHDYALVQKKTQQSAAAGETDTTSGQTTEGQTDATQDSSQQTTGDVSDNATQSGTQQSKPEGNTEQTTSSGEIQIDRPVLGNLQ